MHTIMSYTIMQSADSHSHSEHVRSDVTCRVLYHLKSRQFRQPAHPRSVRLPHVADGESRQTGASMTGGQYHGHEVAPMSSKERSAGSGVACGTMSVSS